VQQDVDHGESVLIFDAGGDVYGIAVSDVKEIVEYPERVVPAPSAPCHVLGLFSIRGKVIPLISIKRFLGSEVESVQGRVIIIQKAGVEVGLEADSAREMVGSVWCTSSIQNPSLNWKAWFRMRKAWRKR